MKLARELAEEKYALKYYDVMEDNFYSILDAILKRENSEDDRIRNYYELRKALIEKLEADGRWIHTPYGFINRSDFRFDTTNGEIVFTNNIINLSNNEYCILKPTPVSVAYFAEHQEDFKHLSDIERLVAHIYKMNKTEVDHFMKLTNTKQGLKEIGASTIKQAKVKLSAPVISYPKEAFINDEVNNTKLFLERFKAEGVIRLIYWLNRLNGEEDIDTLVDSFTSEIEEIRSNENQESYDSKLLKVISRYSTRGPKLSKAYKEKTQVEGKGRKKK